jgi:hypothetical protein
MKFSSALDVRKLPRRDLEYFRCPGASGEISHCVFARNLFSRAPQSLHLLDLAPCNFAFLGYIKERLEWRTFSSGPRTDGRCRKNSG